MNNKTKEIKELEHFFINTTQISIRARDRMLAMLGAIKQELSNEDSEIDVQVVESSDKDEFEIVLKNLLLYGYELKSSSVGFVNSEQYDFCSSYHALLIKQAMKES